MWYWTVLFLMAFSPLLAVELNDLQRSEDWEVALARATDLAKVQKFAESDSLFQLLTRAADDFRFPLLLKAKCKNNHGAMLMQNGKYPDAEAKYLEASRFWIASVGDESDENASYCE